MQNHITWQAKDVIYAFYQNFILYADRKWVPSLNKRSELEKNVTTVTS